MSLSKHPSFCLVFPLNKFEDAFADEVNHFTDAHQDTEGRGDHHEQGEDLLLSGPGDEAVHCVGTR